MAWTQTDIDALKAAIASGALFVQYADKSIRYQSTKDMLSALAAMALPTINPATSARLHA